MAPRGDRSDKSDIETMLAIMMEKMKTLQADNEEIKAKIAAIESKSPKSTRRPSVEPPDGGPITPQSNAISQSEDKRWRPEEIGYFDGLKDADVYAFTDRLIAIAVFKTPKLIQSNIVTLFKGVAFNWYHYELADMVKWALNTSETIDPWCQALIERFKPTQSDLISQLEATRYGRRDAANRNDATAYI